MVSNIICDGCGMTAKLSLVYDDSQTPTKILDLCQACVDATAKLCDICEVLVRDIPRGTVTKAEDGKMICTTCAMSEPWAN